MSHEVLLLETMEPERSGDSQPQAARISRAGPWKRSSGPGTARQCSITGTGTQRVRDFLPVFYCREDLKDAMGPSEKVPWYGG
jgi:hypothetical protein